MRSLDDAATFLRAAKAVAAAGADETAAFLRVPGTASCGAALLEFLVGKAAPKLASGWMSPVMLSELTQLRFVPCENRLGVDYAPPAAAPNAKRMARLRAERSRGAKKGKKGGTRKAKGSGGGGFEL